MRAVYRLMRLTGGSNALELFEPAVVELQLELLVQRVLKIGVDQRAQVLVIGRIALGHWGSLLANRFA